MYLKLRKRPPKLINNTNKNLITFIFPFLKHKFFMNISAQKLCTNQFIALITCMVTDFIQQNYHRSLDFTSFLDSDQTRFNLILINKNEINIFEQWTLNTPCELTFYIIVSNKNNWMIHPWFYVCALISQRLKQSFKKKLRSDIDWYFWW